MLILTKDAKMGIFIKNKIEKERPWQKILLLKAKNPFLTMLSKQELQLNQILKQKPVEEATEETKRISYESIEELLNIILKAFDLKIVMNTFFNTISRGSCSERLGSLRKKVSFSTLSFRLRISMKCMVSTNLFWKYSANIISSSEHNSQDSNS